MLEYIGITLYNHRRTIGLGIAAVAALVYVAGCTPTCESMARSIRTEHRETGGRTTPLPSGSKCHRDVNENAYEMIRYLSKEKREEKARRERLYRRECQQHVPKSRGLEKACEEWRENQ